MSRTHPEARVVSMALAIVLGALIPAGRSPGQSTPASDAASKILSDPEKALQERADKLKEKQRPPIEFFRSQVLPNDILPYLKANHWSMVGIELRANHDDYDGSLQSRPVPLAGQPHEIVYRRDARLVKAQRARLTLPIMLPEIPKELGFQLIRPEAIQRDEEWLASLRPLEPHQQMVVVLSKGPNDQYARWSQMRATIPASARKDDPLLLDRQRYYRLVLPLDVDKPLLSAHPLTWSAISHVVWDALPPELLGVAQQEALVDWLHWGGQLIVVGGAGPAFAPLRESFLADYLPAEASGENVLRSGDQLKGMSDAYPPLAVGVDADDPIASNIAWADVYKTHGLRYRDPVPIPSTEKKPMFFAGLTPKPGASVIPLGGPDDPPLGVEWKVGRGRVLMLSVSLTDPDLIGWAGYDTFIRRVVLRRPEEPKFPMTKDASGGIVPAKYGMLPGPDLTGVRYLSRDMGAPTRQIADENETPANAGYTVYQETGRPTTAVPVGEWLDSAELPKMSRDALEKASGIEIPGPDFVLKVIAAYILVLVPINYLICRFLIRRREWAWAVVPTLSLAFAIGVERAAAFDVGFDTSCDEVDLIETHGAYPKGHISRFASLYATGRVKFTISYPNDPTALALPLATGVALKGEDIAQSSFQAQPIPALTGFQVQPRSLALFRAEQLAPLPGTVTLSPEGQGPVSVVNESGLDLNDAWVIEVRKEKDRSKDLTMRAASLGSIAAGAKVALGALDDVEPTAPAGTGQLHPSAFLKLLLDRAVARTDDEVGELRLVAWADKTLPGQAIEPPVDRKRGFTLVVAHLRPAPLLDPASPRYNDLQGDGVIPKEPPAPPPDPNMIYRRGGFPPGTTFGPNGTITIPAQAGGIPGATPPPIPVTPPPPPPPTPTPPTSPPTPPGVIRDPSDPGSAPSPDASTTSNATESPRP